MAETSPPRDAASWDCIERALREAMELAPAERERFLARIERDDPALHAEIVELLAASVEAGEFLATPAAEYAAGLTSEEAPAPPVALGKRVGAYEIREEIGRGGMGTVYLAVRADGFFDQRVALKLLKRGMDSEEIQRRFVQERQILAWLKHPNIASLLDGGITEEGAPYFVMEYVEGTPITRYCDLGGLGVRARVRLFQDVLRGVHHAHLNLVVHRDLKPPNILVTREGRVKLLDFGVAKLLGGERAADVTRVESRMLTPQYAAPEQITGSPITVATDVYALGIVLYEILCGRLPYVVTASIAGERIALEHDPSPPSTAILRPSPGDLEETQADGAKIAAARKASIEQLRRQLRGDLDNIVLKALRKRPEDRYATVDAFHQDLEAYATERPVLARPHSASYRARKFVRRHRVGVAASLFVLVAFLAGVGGVIWQARETAREARKTEVAKQFLVSLFELADPSESGGQTITTRQLLDRGAQRIETELSGEPDVKAELMSTVGWMYHKLGAYEEARSLLEKAVAIDREVPGGERQLARVLAALATVLQAQGKYDEAERCFRESLDRTRKLRGKDHIDVAYRLNDLAVLLKEKGDRDGAEKLQREALAMKRRTAGKNDLAVASTLNNLAVLVSERGDLDEAAALYREALDIRRAKLGNEHLLVVSTLHNLMVLLRQKEDLDAAEPLAREVLQIRRRVLGDHHPDVGVSLYNLAAILRSRKSYEEAEPLFREAIEVARAAKGDDHPDVASMMSGLATLLRGKGDRAAAESVSREALARVDGRLAPDHPVRAAILLELGQNLLDQGRIREAEPVLRAARDAYVAKLGARSLLAADAQFWLGSCYLRGARYAEAEPELRGSYAAYEARLGAGGERSRRAAEALAALDSAWKRPVESASP